MDKNIIKNEIKEHIKRRKDIDVRSHKANKPVNDKKDFAAKYPNLILTWNRNDYQFDTDRIYDIIGSATKEQLGDENSYISKLIDDWNNIK